MKKLGKRQIILLGALVIVIIYYVIDSGLFSTAEAVAQIQKIGGVGGKARSQEIEDVEKYTRVAAIVELDWTGGWKKDPFFYVSPDTLKGSRKGGLINQLFGAGDKSQVSGFKLTGISWLGNSGFALINEGVVKEGDVIGGYTVDRVAFNYVILRQGTKTLRLTLNE